MVGLLLLLLTVWFDGVPTSCLLDTGSEVTVLSESAATRIGTLSAPVANVTLNGVGAGSFAGTYRWAPNIGTHELGWLGAWVVVAPDASIPAPCILGADLLSQQPIWIDWQAGTVRPA